MPTQMKTAEMKALRMRWVLAHEPTTTFEAAARRFADILRQETGGAIEADVISASQYRRGERLSPAQVVELVRAGEIEMCQTYTSALGQLHEPLWALDLPYLFTDHAHAARALDGKPGQELLAGLAPHGLRGLAFTYSGGYRIIVSDKAEIRGAEDLKGLRVRCAQTPVAEAVLKALGAVPVPAPLHEVAELSANGLIDAAEITYPRYVWQDLPKRLSRASETHHSLLLTAMVVSEKFWAGLTQPQRAAIEHAAVAAAKIERATSIAEGDDAMARSSQLGFRRVEVAAAARARMTQLTAPVYAQFERFAPVVTALRG